MKARGQALGLQAQDDLAALAQVIGGGGHEGGALERARHVPLVKDVAELKVGGEAGARVVGAGAPGGGAAALLAQALEVDVGSRHAVRKERRLREQRAVLGHDAVTREHEVGGGLAETGVGVGVGAVQAGALVGDELPAVRRLADDLVGRREVEDERGAGLGHVRARRVGRPQVLADLDAHHEVGHVERLVHEPRGEKRLLPGAGHEQRLRGARRRAEPALLVELAVVGQVGLGREAHKLAAHAHRGAVVDRVARAHGQAHGKKDRQVGRLGENMRKSALRRSEQSAVVEEVAAGVARKAELGQNERAHAVRSRLAHGAEHGRRVVLDVGYAQPGRGSRHAEEAVVGRIGPGIHKGLAFPRSVLLPYACCSPLYQKIRSKTQPTRRRSAWPVLVSAPNRILKRGPNGYSCTITRFFARRTKRGSRAQSHRL